MATQTTITTIKKLPPVKEDVGYLKQRVQDLEKEVLSYKNRLDELRKAKNNLIIKKTTEYVNMGAPAPAQGPVPRERRLSSINNENGTSNGPSAQESPNNTDYLEELEKVIESLTVELRDTKDHAHALKLENEELKNHLGRIKKESNEELAQSLQKNEEYKREIKKWEEMYKEWMTMMENRVANINRTHQLLQQVIRNPDETTETPSTSSK